jgi:glycosyltransferase involved in cell wall biosynthesis
MNNQKIDDPDLQSDTFRVTYAGAIRATNDVTGILDAAKLLQSHKDIQFLIYGEGNMTDGIRRKIEKDDIANVKLKGFIERKYIPYLLSKSSVNLLNYSPVKYNWSRGCSSNKLFEYMASGKPVLSTVKTGHSIIEKYRCGIELTEATPEALASAIAAIRNMPPDEYRRLGENARKGAEDFDYAKLAGKLEMVIEGFLKKSSIRIMEKPRCANFFC